MWTARGLKNWVKGEGEQISFGGGGGGTFKGRLEMSRFTIKHHDDQTLSFLQIYNTELHLDVYIYTLFSVLCNDSSYSSCKRSG